MPASVRSRNDECTTLAAMTLVSPASPIRFLPAQLADQIAAGEVIERPASVLKELIENALDAGSRRIDIELLRGGIEAIRVTDDGHGIPADQMTLAISRHATSKISRLDDLMHLQSLGFRGEALASICSVSQWEMTSHARGEASAYALRYEQAETLLPMNHATGTSVGIRKLFFNTPARRKFLRAERTEYRHCDEIVRRMALSHFGVAFYLKHNGRQVHRLPAVQDDIGRSRRVSQLCGEAFVRHCRTIDFPHGDMRLWGWISTPEYSRQQSDLQYFYINGRIIRDRVVNHAMRLAYQTYLSPGRHAAYVLHLELDPASVDINVHPTKHEVRFREARLIHDFLSRCLRESLRGAGITSAMVHESVHESQAAYVASSAWTAQVPAAEKAGAVTTDPFFGNLQSLLHNRFALMQSANGLYLIDVLYARAGLSCRDWQQAWEQDDIKSRPLLIPSRQTLDTTQQHHFEQQQALLAELGFEVTQASPGQILLRAVPVWLQGFDATSLVLALLNMTLERDSVFMRIEQSLLSQSIDITHIDFKHFLNVFTSRRDELTACWCELTPADLSDWVQQQAK